MKGKTMLRSVKTYFLEMYRLRKEDIKKKPIVERQIKEILSRETFPLFRVIQIETINRCNLTCSFCPVNKFNDIREFAKMDRHLFINIIEQLKALGYRGKVGLFSNNEPLLDDRLCEFAEMAKNNLPNAHIYIYTNATLLTLEKFLDLIKYLDRMVIDNYHDDGKLIKPVQIIHDYIESNNAFKDKVKICIRKRTAVLTSRGGNSPNKIASYIPKSSCLHPFQQLVVRPDGKISLCCVDAYGEITLGDLSKQTAIDIWNGELYTGIRNQIMKSRKTISVCSKCDYIPGLA